MRRATCRATRREAGRPVSSHLDSPVSGKSKRETGERKGSAFEMGGGSPDQFLDEIWEVRAKEESRRAPLLGGGGAHL